MESYAVTHTLGRGAFGQVRRAIHLPTGELAAVKTVFVRTVDGNAANVDGDLALPRNLFRELNALRACEGPHVVRLREAFATGRSLAMVLEHCDTDLRTVLERSRGQMSEAAAKAVATQVLAAVAHVHACGVLHRDVKSANFLFTRRGRLKLADFGLARPLAHGGAADTEGARSSGACTPTAAGTRWYRAPELLFGATSYGAGSDVWAAACVCHEAADARAQPPCQGDSDVHQIALTARLLGAPAHAEEARLDACPDYRKLTLSHDAPYSDEESAHKARARRLLRGRRGGSYASLRSLLSDALRWTPHDRPAARDLRSRAWFFVPPAPLEEEQLVDAIIVPALEGGAKPSGDDEW